MPINEVRRTVTMFAVAGLAAFALATFIQSGSVLASPPPPPAHLNPMRLATLQLPAYAIPVAPSPEFSGNVSFTLTSSGGPFCLQGLFVQPFVSSSGMVGDAWINVDRINGGGASHPYLTLVEGQGFAPQDLILSYGSTICVSSSITFQARQFAAPSGPGQPIGLDITAVYLSAADVIITAS
jgi:hypothetical protein